MLKGLMLFMVALVLTVFFSSIFIPMSVVYHAILPHKWKVGWDRAGSYLHQMALSIDQFANVSLQSLFNIIMIKKEFRGKVIGQRKKLRRLEDKDVPDNLRIKWVWEYYDQYDFTPFGDEDDTLSYVFAKNYYDLKLNWFGIIWAKMLDLVDPNHLIKAVENKDKRDIEALERLVKKGCVIDYDCSKLNIAAMSSLRN